MTSLPQKTHRRKVLLIGRDSSLLRTRGLVLQSTRAWVSQRTPQAGGALLRRKFFDVVVLCHTVSLRECIALCKEVKLFWPLTGIVVILQSEDQPAPECEIDCAVPWTHGPARLIQVVQSMRLGVAPALHSPSAFAPSHDTGVSDR